MFPPIDWSIPIVHPLSIHGWYAVDIFCSIPINLHSSCMNFNTNRGSWLLIILLGSLKWVTMCLRYSAAVPSVLISSMHGIKIAALVQLWSVTVRMESNPCDMGSLVMKSIATVLNGVASDFGYIDLRDAFVGWLLTLCYWHLVHPFI